LFRHEVEALVVEKYGSDYLDNKKIQNELKAINSELRKIKSRQKTLEKKKAELEAMLK
jgi:predicted transcriptional regulator